jgi:trimethylamine--corrinoid protein Co-methyltransferase
VHFGTGGAAVQTLDLDSGDYRASTLQDLYDFARLQDQLTNVSWFTRCCVATDLVGEEALDLNTAYALLAGTSKPVATSFTLAEHVAPIVKMMDMAEGREGAFSERPWLAAHISPMISPLRFGADAVEVCFECVAHNITVSCITAAQSGATAPATPAGFLAQSLAETLAALAMVHVMKPGHPMIFSNWPFVIDLRSGAFSGGGGEIALMNAASAQLSNWLGLVSGVASSMTDSKAIDAQYGAEKGVTALAAALSGANMIYESAGMTAALLGASFQGFVLDNDMLGNIYRMLRGVEVTEENLGFEVIVDAGPRRRAFPGPSSNDGRDGARLFLPGDRRSRGANYLARTRQHGCADPGHSQGAHAFTVAPSLFVGRGRCSHSRGLRHPTATTAIAFIRSHCR